MKSDAEVATLKRQWEADPCWDIEETEGFQEHWPYLFSYRQEVEAEVERKFQLKLERKALSLGSNTALAAVILKLEQQVRELTRRLDGASA